MNNKAILAALKKNAMLIVLVLVYLFFLILTKGGIFSPSSFAELINQNAYVYILGAGMLMCMLTGGNIDLSCGAFVCLLGAFGGVFMIVQGLGTGVSIALMLLIGVVYGCVLGYLIAYVHIPPWIATLAGYLAFRGLGTSILSANSKTGSLAPFPVDFQNIFYGRVFPTEKGVQLVQIVPESLKSAKTTAEWETVLQHIEHGNSAVSDADFVATIENQTRALIRDYSGKQPDKASNPFYQQSEREQIGICPKCGKPVMDYPKSYSCSSGKDGCGFVIWKTMSGKAISPAQAKKLLEKKKTDLIKGFTSKAGKSFDAYVILKSDYTTGFEFPPRK